MMVGKITHINKESIILATTNHRCSNCKYFVDDWNNGEWCRKRNDIEDEPYRYVCREWEWHEGKQKAEWQLKRCPFCNGEASYVYDPEGIEQWDGLKWRHYVTCDRCCASTGVACSKERAVEAWNRRAE